MARERCPQCGGWHEPGLHDGGNPFVIAGAERIGYRAWPASASRSGATAPRAPFSLDDTLPSAAPPPAPVTARRRERRAEAARAALPRRRAWRAAAAIALGAAAGLLFADVWRARSGGTGPQATFAAPAGPLDARASGPAGGADAATPSSAPGAPEWLETRPLGSPRGEAAPTNEPKARLTVEIFRPAGAADADDATAGRAAGSDPPPADRATSCGAPDGDPTRPYVATMPEMTAPPGHKAGFVALVGLPNVGKSTLLNGLVGERLAIVTPKAQTTRRKLLGIYSDAGHQAVFIDTPGLLEPRYTLQKAMREEALSALQDADVVVAVVDAAFEPSLAWLDAFQAKADTRKILCINKMDRVSEDEIEGIRRGQTEGGWRAIVPTDARSGAGVDQLRSAILEALPVSPPYYPRDELSDAPVREFVAELIRETCLEELDEEVPYAIAVRVDEFKEREGGKPTYIGATLYVERESQKGIVVGSGGKTIRRIGSRARQKIEEFLDHAVYLDLRVKRLANWRKSASQLRVLGFKVPSEVD